MFKKGILVLTLVLGIAISAFAGDCNNENFYGTYTYVPAPTDVMGDGTVIHQYVYTLILAPGGTVYQHWSGLPDYQINAGTGTPSIGSWKCRADGKLVVTYLLSSYAPVNPDAYIAYPDVALATNYRTTLLFNINGRNKITRIQARSRAYGASDDPTNPNGGTLGALSTTHVVYNRLIANDSDLTAP
jgi:hypothetical protein